MKRNVILTFTYDQHKILCHLNFENQHTHNDKHSEKKMIVEEIPMFIGFRINFGYKISIEKGIGQQKKVKKFLFVIQNLKPCVQKAIEGLRPKLYNFQNRLELTRN